MADKTVNSPKWQEFAASLEQDRGLPSGLLHSIAMNETNGGDPAWINKASSAGAQGMFQFMPGTATQYNVNVKDRADSTRGAADYLSDLVKQYNDPHLAAAAYNWGPGNLNKAIAKAKAAGLSTDAKTLADNGLLPKETADYVRKLPAAFGEQSAPQATSGVQQFKPEEIEQVRKQVTDMAFSGAGSSSIVADLSKSKVAPVVQKLKDAGYSPDEIVQRIGGKPYSDMMSAISDRDRKGAIQNTWDGAKAGGSDLVLGGKQILGIGDKEALQQEAAANEADPARRALMNTTGGKVGSITAQVAPLAVADILAPEIGAPMTAARIASVLGRGAAIGGAQGALAPVTEDGQRTDNIIHGAAMGGAVGGAVGAGGAVLGGAARAARGISADEAAAAVRAADSAGIPVGAADIAPGLRGISNQANKVPFAKMLGGSNDAAQEAAYARAITKRIGQDSDVLDSGVISAAQRDLGKQFDDVVDGVTVTPTNHFTTELDGILSKESSKLPSLQNSTVKNIVDELKTASGGSIEAKALQSIRSDISKRMTSQTLEPEAKQALGSVNKAIDNELERALPADKLALFKKTNDQWRHLQVAENLVRATNDSGEGIAKRLAAAVKQGPNKAAFERGAAPYQDLVDVTNSMNPAARTGELDKAFQLATGIGAYHNPVALAGIPLAAGLKRALNTTNPTVRNLLLGIPSEATQGAAALTRAITGRTGQVAAMPDQQQAQITNQRAVADALAAKAAQASQAAGLMAQTPVAANPGMADIQKALAAALAQRAKR